MKFSEMLKRNKNEEFEDKYINYELLKNKLAPGFSQEMEFNFVELLKNEISKFNIFVSEKHVDFITKKEELDYNNEENYESLKTKMYNFAEFIKENLIGLKKIFKKHDKITGFILTKDFGKFLKSKKSEIKNIKFLISSINEEIKGSKKGNDKKFNVQKYLIPQENIVSLKLAIMKHLPETHYVNDVEKIEDSYINTIYLDNSNFDLYKKAIDVSPSSFYIRFRWFGCNKNIIFCEMVENYKKGNYKISFKLIENTVFQFIEGKDIWKLIEHLNKKEDFEIYEKIQKKITEMNLKPSIRTFFRRFIFENGEKTTRINLDSNIVMIKENSIENDTLKGWKRNDIIGDWPFRNVPASEILRFPYSLLTVLSKSDNDWLIDVLSTSNIIKNDIFSIYVHGIATLHPSAHKMPIWMAQIENATDDPEILYRKSTGDDAFVQFSGESEISYDISSLTNGRNQIVIPVRVEPKAFFANERTFLSWVQFAIFLGGIGTAMVGLGNEHAYICGAMFIGIAAIFAFYSLYLFHYRASRIRSKDPGPYDTNVGPVVLVGIFILVMVLSFIFKFPIKKNGLQTH